MKNLTLILVMTCISLFVFFSCSSDSNSDTPTELEGTWVGTSLDANNNVKETVTLKFNGKKVSVSQQVPACSPAVGGYNQAQDFITHNASFDLSSGIITANDNDIIINDKNVTGRNGDFCFRWKTYPDSSQYYDGKIQRSGNTLNIRTRKQTENNANTTFTASLTEEGDILSIHTTVTEFKR